MKTHIQINEQTYDSISKDWDTKRQYYWKPVVDFINQIENKKNSSLVDLGCGGGRHLELAEKEGFQKQNLIGQDISKNQLKTVEQKGYQTIQSNLTELPIENNSFDYIICIAAHHHLLEKGDQLKALEEMKRILKPNGKILLANWFPEKDFLDKQIKKKKFKFQDEKKQSVKVTYSHNEKKFDRYYYLFKEDELKDLCIKTNLKILNSEHHKGNLYLTLE